MKLTSLVVLLTLLFSFGIALGQSISLDHVDGLVVGDPTKVLVGEPVVFHLRTTNDTEQGFIAAGNGYRIYSDDGAVWGTFSFELLNGYGDPATFPGTSIFLQFFANTFGVTGSGADTVGLSGINFMPGTGVLPGYDQITYAFTIGPIAADQHGKTVCLDSSFAPPGTTWKWSSPGGVVGTPSWDGPHCYTIHDPNAPTNQAPVLDPVGNKSGDEGTTITFAVSASDPDLTTPSLSATGLPTGATFVDNGDGTGTFSWTTDFDDEGDYAVTFIASDGELTDEEAITVTVNNTNRSPVLLPIGPKGVQAETNLNFGATASDPDGTTPTLSASPLPTGATFTDNGDGTGTFDWTPTAAQEGDHLVTFAASDGDLTDDEVVTITVSGAANEPPVLAAIGNKSVNEGETLTFDISASDPNGTTPSLAATGLPDGATFVDNGDGTGTFTWATDFDDAGDFAVSFTASDGEFSDGEGISITVNNVNRPPVLAEIGSKIVGVETNLNFLVSATDPDGTTPTLTAAVLPTGATFVDNGDGTGTFDWTPAADQTGDHDVTFTASDGELTDDEVVTITVAEAPRVLEVAPATLAFVANEGDILVPSQTFDVSEQGDNTIDYTASTEAGWIGLAGITGTTPGQVTVEISKNGLAPGSYLDSVKVESPDAINSPLYVLVSLELTPCPVLLFQGPDDGTFDEVVWEATIIEGETVMLDDALVLGGGLDPVVIDWTAGPSTYFTVTPASGQTPSSVSVTYERASLVVGSYADTLTISSDPIEGNTCASEVRVIANITVFPQPSADTLLVATAPAVPGMSVTVPITFTNSCMLNEISASVSWTSEYLFLDSISYEETVLVDFTHIQSIDHDLWVAYFYSTGFGGYQYAPNSQQNWLNLHFTVSCDAPFGFYPLPVPFMFPDLFFMRNCGIEPEQEVPEVVAGGINVGTTDLYFCGWVVEESTGEEITGASVEMWDNFPSGSALMTTTSSGIGSFAFTDFETCQFDLWVYKEGYYPQQVVDLDCFEDKGTKVELIRVEELVPPIPSEWVDYYCENNTYLGAPLPVGSVVEVRVRGLLAGQTFVTDAGQYGFMPVYRASELFGDNGASTGDTLRFLVNGRAAVATGDVIYPEDYMQVEVCLEAGSSVIKECILSEGWNLVSWNVDTESDDILQVLGDYMGDIEVVLGFEQGGLTYDPDLPTFSTLWQVDHLSGYWIRVKEGSSITLSLEGFQVPVNTEIPLTLGWNLVSYLPEVTLTPEEALASIADHLLFAYGFAEGGVEVYQPGGEFNQLDEMASCNGYWAKVDADGILVYPNGGAPFTAPAWSVPTRNSIATASATGVEPTTSWINLYSSSLYLDGAIVSSGAVVTAHAVSNGSTVGSFTIAADGQFGFMPVYAGDDSPLRAGEMFYLAIDGIKTNEQLEWTGNGNRVEVSLLTANGGAETTLPGDYSLNQNYPNPFNPSTNISFTLGKAARARVEVFNILGALIATPFNGQASAGQNLVVWDGRNTNGELVASGVYLYRLSTDSYSETRKMMLLK